jgi:carboxypeptidase family protein
MLFCSGRVRVGAMGWKLKIVVMCLMLGCGSAGMTGRAGAQTSVDGAISGFVVDASGAALAGADVRVQRISTGLEIAAKTGSKGEFLVPRVPAGDYQVVVDYARLPRLTLDGVVVEVGGVTSVEARLRVGASDCSDSDGELG